MVENHWWARQDSNLQPDRYERPALTIELQAPPACRGRGRQRCGHPLQCGWRSGNAAILCRHFDVDEPFRGVQSANLRCALAHLRSGHSYHPGMTMNDVELLPEPSIPTVSTAFWPSLPRRPRTRPPCAIFRFRRRSTCRIRPASSALGFRRFRPAARPPWGLSRPRRSPC
jgi:hypothetical protein